MTLVLYGIILIVGLDMEVCMKIDNNVMINMKPLSQGGIVLEKATEENLERFEIKDEINISKEGQQKLDDLTNIQTYEIDIEILMTSDSPEDMVNNLFVDAALKYKEKLSELTDPTQIEALNAAYMKSIENSIDRIASDIDGYFDRGRILGDQYAEKPLEDLFDKEAFAENLKASVLKVRDDIVANDWSEEEIQSHLAEQKSSSIEELSFEDLKGVYELVKMSPPENDYDLSSGEDIAKREQDLNQRVRDSNVSYIVRHTLYQVHERESQTYMKHAAFEEEKEMFQEGLLGFDEELMSMWERLRQLGVVIDEVKENFGINPNNKRLLNLLSRQEALTEEYNALKEERSKFKEAFDSLDRNKHTIVEKDSYKRIKAEYDHEMEAS